jgi:hypothetical protein
VTQYIKAFDTSHATEHQRLSRLVTELGESTEALAEPGWDDLRVDVTSGTKPNQDPPGFEVFRDGIRAYGFAPGATEQVYFDVQLPHTWDAGTGIRPHVHWSPGSSTNDGDVVWRLEYTWANAVAAPGNVFPETETLTVTQAAAGVAYSHQIAQWTEIDGTGKRLSSVLMCRLFRVGGDAADTFTGDAFALSVDFHIQVQGNGSTEEYPDPEELPS